MRSAECGIEMGGRPPIDTRSDIPHSAFRIPYFPVPWPVVHLNQLFQRLDSPLPGPSEERAQDIGRGERIDEGAMTRRIVDAEERRQVVEAAMAQLRHQPAGETNRAQGPARGSRHTR